MGPGESIQDAIDAADPWDTICVGTGTYDENLQVTTEGVTIAATSGANPVLQGSSGTGVHIDGASNVTVEGLEIRGYATGVRIENSPNATIASNTITENDQAIRDFDTPSHDMVIVDNVIEHNPIRGVSIQGSDRVQITGNHLEANGNSASGTGLGIYIRGGAGGEEVTIEGNTIANHDGGISVWTPNAVISENTITDHTVYGINLRTGLNSQNAHDAVVESNTFDNEGTSIQASSVRNTEVRNNTFSGQGTDVDFGSVRDAVIIDNDFSTGILLSGGTLAHFDHDASGNTIGGGPFVYMTGEDDPAIPTDAGQIIVVDSTNVDVSGFEIDGVAAGIQIAYSPGVVVTDNTVTNTTGHGIRLWASSGAVVEDNVVSHAMLGSDTSGPAIGVSGSSGATVANNDITETDGRALRVTSSPNAEIRENTLTDNYGGLFLSGSDDATVADNTISGTHHGGGNVGSFRSAILVTSGERIQFTGNHIHDNAGNGIHDNRGPGARYAVMTDNVITNNGNDGIYWRNSRDATFTNNTVSNNDRAGIAGPFGATVTENTVEHNSGAGIDVSHESLVEANLVHNNAGNGVMVNRNAVVRDNTITDSEGAGIFLRYFGDQIIENNDISGHDTDLVIFETEAVTVRDNTFETGVLLISSSNPYSTLEEDLSTHSFSGNTVAGKELYYATGVDNPQIPADPGQVIIVNSTSVTVSDLEFDGVTAPIQIAFSDATVTNNTVSNSTGSTVQRVGAITLWASDNSLVADNVVTSSAYDGLRVVESEGVDLARNTVTDGDRNGIRLEGATNTTITDDTISNPGSRGLYAERSAGLTIDGVTVENSGWDGLSIDRSDGTTIVQSTVTGSDGQGIYLRATDGAVLEGNTVRSSGGTGIESDFGIYTSDNARVTGNTVTDNGDTGIDFGASGIESIEITSNTVSRNLIGIQSTNDAVVTDNVVTENLVAGIFVSFQPDGIQINGNELENNGIGVDYDRGTWSNYEPVDATNNWWGAANGPSGGVTDPVTGTVANGDGDSVTENVRFEPWVGDNVAIVDVTLDKTEVGVDEDVLVTTILENTGSETASITLSLEVDGATVDSLSVPVDAGETDTAEFVHSFGEAGEYVVSVNGVAAGTVTVVAESVDITYADLSLSSTDLYTGSTVVVSATVENEGSEDGSYESLLSVDGTVVDQQSGTLAPGESRTLTFFTQLETSGEIEVTVADLPAETVTVTAAWTQEGFGDNNVGHGVELTGPVLSPDEQWQYTAGSQSWHYVQSSPAVVDGVVYVGSWPPMVHAVDVATGETIWTVDTDGAVVTAPAVADGVVYVTSSTVTQETSYGTVYAIDADGGSVLWSETIGEPLTSPRIVAGTLYVGSDDGSLYALDPTDGSELWSFETGRQLETTPAVSNGVVYVATSPRSGQPIDERVYAIEAASGTELWNADEPVLVNTALTTVDGVVYVADFTGIVYAYDAEDGTLLWDSPVSASAINGAPAVAEGVVYVGSDDNHVYALEADAGTELWSFETGGDVRSSPAVANGVVYVGSFDDHLYALNANTGDELWAFETGDSVWSSPAVLDGVVYVGSQDGRLYAIGEGELPAAFTIIEAFVSDRTVVVGESVDTTVQVMNQGGSAGEYTAELQVDGVPVATETATIEAGEIVTLTLTHQFDDPGTYPIAVDGISLGSIDVMAGAQEPFFAVTIDGTNTPVTEGDALEVDVTVQNTGTVAGTQTVLLVPDNGEAIVDAFDSQSVSLDPGDETSFTLWWATADGDAGEDIPLAVTSNDATATTTVTVTGTASAPTPSPTPSPDPAFFAVTLDDAPSPILSGEVLAVTATVENTGDSAGTQTMELVVDGTVVDATSLTLDTGESAQLPLSWTTPDAGDEVDIEVRSDDDVDSATVVVEDVDPEANIILYGASADRDHVTIGQSVVVTADLYNAGDLAGSRTIALSVDGDVVDETTVTVRPGIARGGVELVWTPQEDDLPAGEDTMDVTLSVDGLFVETVTVEHQYTDIRVIAASASEVELVAGEQLYVIGSIYQAGTIEGPETIELTATNIDTGESAVVGTQEVTLSPGFYHLGALNVTFQPEHAGTYDLELGGRSAGTVEVQPAFSDIQVIAASPSAIELVAGEQLYVIGSIYQAGTIEGPETIELTATNVDTGETAVVGTQEVTLSPGFYHLGALNVTFQPESAGTYDLELGSRSAGTVEVEAAVSDIQVIAASASAVELVEGEQLYVIGSIYQAGTVEGPETIELTATNVDTGQTTVVGSQDVSLSPGFYHLGVLNVTFQPESAGTYDLELGGRSAGTVEVEAAISDIQVIAASVSAVELVEGEAAYVIGSIYQAGTVEGTETIELTATNVDTGQTTVVGSQDVSLSPGYYHLGALNVTYQPDHPGTYDLELGGRNAGTVTVAESESDIVVIAASVSDVELIEGEGTYVIGSIYQAGTAEGPETIELTATNVDTGETEVVGSQQVTLAPGYYHLGALNVTFQPESAGTYELELGGREAGTVAVDEALTDIQVIGTSVSAVELIEGEQLYVIGSIYQAGNVEGTQTIELTATNVDTGETTVVGSQDVSLAPGYYHLGALNVTYQPESAGTYQLSLGDRNAGTVEVEAAFSDIRVIAASPSEIELVADEQLYVIGSIYQAGTVEGTETVELTATNQETGETTVVGSQDVSLAPGYYHLGALNVTFQPDAPGTYDLELGGRSAGTVEVEPAFSDIKVIAASPSAIEVIEGEQLYVIGSIYQAGTVEGTETIELTATNVDTDETEVVGTQDVSLAPGFYHLGALNVSAQFDAPGTYDLELGGRSAGTVEVQPAVSDIRVIAASPSAIETVAGEQLYVIGSIYQAGTVEGPETIELTATNVDTGESAVVGTQEVSLRPGFYHLGALNVSAQITTVGTYDLELGERDAGTVTVTPASIDPSVAAVIGHSTGIDLDTGDELVFASDEATVEVDVTADLDVADVTLLVESLETSYAVSTAGTHQDGDRWIIDVPIWNIPDDGRYSLSVFAVDVIGTAGMDVADEILVVDRNGPSMAASLEDVTMSDATLVVESDEPLSGVPTVVAEFVAPDGTTSPATVTMDDAGPSPTRFTGTLVVDEPGEYVVTVTGTDRAGNEATDEASVVVHTKFTLADGRITFPSGSSIDFDLIDDADQAIKSQELFLALSENEMNPNVNGGDLGVGFMTADMDSFIDYYLEEGTIESATISMAIDEESLPSGVSADAAQMHYYDASTDQWDPVETEVTVVDDTPFLVSTVTHFSTYGALIADDEPPRLVDISTFESADGVTVRFEYEDALSGVDVRSVSLLQDGTDVTANGQITSSAAEYTVESTAGTSHTIAVVVGDNAGNDATYETTVTFPVSDSDSVSEDATDTDGDSTSEHDTEQEDDGDTDTTSQHDTETDHDRDSSIPGFGALAALLALSLVALLSRHRQD
ncbi:right-handed parallel beta-helix repeat-containing protein [Natrialbaceae archaeon A-CW2]